MTTRLQTKSGANKFSLGWQRLQRCDKNVRKNCDESCILRLKTKPKISINTAIFCCETIFIRHEYLFHAILSKKKTSLFYRFHLKIKSFFCLFRLKSALWKGDMGSIADLQTRQNRIQKLEGTATFRFWIFEWVKYLNYALIGAWLFSVRFYSEFHFFFSTE